MFKIAIVEDQEETRESLNRFVRQYAQEQGLQVEISLITDGAEIAEHYTPGIDIIFMDVEMPRLDGFEAAEAIRAADADVVLVFVTNMAQYAIRGYEVDALDYVLKPVNYYQFCTSFPAPSSGCSGAEAGRWCCSWRAAASSCWIPLISIIWRPTAGCCTTTPQRRVRGTRQPAKCRKAACRVSFCPLQPMLSGQSGLRQGALKTTLPL